MRANLSPISSPRIVEAPVVDWVGQNTSNHFGIAESHPRVDERFISMRKKRSSVSEHPRFPKSRPRAYETFFILNSAEHEISKLDKSNLINRLERHLTCRDFHCFCLSNQSFKFNLPYSLKDKLGFKV